VPVVYAEVAMLQTVLEGVPLPAEKHELIRYAREQGDAVPWDLLERLPDGEYRSLDEVGEALAPVQPAAGQGGSGVPVGGTPRFPRTPSTGPLRGQAAPPPHAESGLPPGGDDYLDPFPVPGGVRHDAPPDNPPQKAIEQQTKRQNEQKERQQEQLGG
jgi:hypothetical protein